MLQMVIDANSLIRNALEKGSKMDLLMEQWDFLQSQCACFINSDLPGLPSQLHQAPGKPVKCASCLVLKQILSLLSMVYLQAPFRSSVYWA